MALILLHRLFDDLFDNIDLVLLFKIVAGLGFLNTVCVKLNFQFAVDILVLNTGRVLNALITFELGLLVLFNLRHLHVQTQAFLNLT